MEQREFDYEQSLWDNVILELLKQVGYMNAVAAADAVLAARRATFTTQENS